MYVLLEEARLRVRRRYKHENKLRVSVTTVTCFYFWWQRPAIYLPCQLVRRLTMVVAALIQIGRQINNIGKLFHF